MPTNVAKIIDKGPGDHTLILNTRCQCIYPFDAPNWTDLRVAFLLSLCSQSDDDPVSPITGLAETLPAGDPSHLQEYTFIGLKSNTDTQVGQNVGFIGYSTYDGNPEGQSDLKSSDAGVGAGTTFWRPRIATTRPETSTSNAIVMDATRIQARFLNVNPHFVQNVSGAGGYSTLLMLRVQRSSSRSRNLTISIKQGTFSSDILFSSDDDSTQQDLLETNMVSYPGTVQTKIVNNMANIPDALYCYWPFHLSRLRVSALGFIKFR